MTRCSSCSAPILWAVNARGISCPLDPDPRDDGNLIVTLEPDGTRRVQDFCGLFDRGPRYVSHFATCPDADYHRRSA